MGKKKVTAVILCLLLSATLCSCGVASDSYTGFCMGSVLSARLYGKETQTLWEDLSAAAAETDGLLSTSVESSDISKLNRNSSVMAQRETVEVVTETVEACNLTDRCLDITLGNVTALWGFNTDTPSLPSDDDITEALSHRSIDGIAINEVSGRIAVEKGQTIDLGAVGKGAGCDAIYKVLLKQSTPAVISLGGTVLLFGTNPDGGAWKVGIRNPFGTAEDYFAVLNLTVSEDNNALYISTSGSYEKQFEEDGVVYHHILDPETGYPVQTDLVGVTVVAAGGVMSDALSTACFVGGLNEDTLQWLENYDAEAVFVFDDGSYYVTDGLKDVFSLTEKTGFSLYDYEAQQ